MLFLMPLARWRTGVEKDEVSRAAERLGGARRARRRVVSLTYTQSRTGKKLPRGAVDEAHGQQFLGEQVLPEDVIAAGSERVSRT